MRASDSAGGGQPGRPLPPGLDLLWGRRETGRRGPSRGLSVDEIVDAAIRIADADGLDGVSMARVADELGFTTMSLYRYVTGKDELLQLMWNASARSVVELELSGDDWRSRLRSWAVVQREVIDQHRWIAQMPMAAPPLGPTSLRFVELGLAALDGTGLDDGDKLRVLGILSSYTLSDARMAHDAARAGEQARAAAAGGADTGPPWTFEALLRELVDEETYPRLYRLALAEEHGGGEPASDEHAEFLFAVELILDGVQALIDASARHRHGS
jgi:AcrR family transcriptional regulator